MSCIPDFSSSIPYLLNSFLRKLSVTSTIAVTLWSWTNKPHRHLGQRFLITKPIAWRCCCPLDTQHFLGPTNKDWFRWIYVDRCCGGVSLHLSEWVKMNLWFGLQVCIYCRFAFTNLQSNLSFNTAPKYPSCFLALEQILGILRRQYWVTIHFIVQRVESSHQLLFQSHHEQHDVLQNEQATYVLHDILPYLVQTRCSAIATGPQIWLFKMGRCEVF